MKHIQEYTDQEGRVTYSLLGSWLAWREQDKITEVPRDEHGTCSICGGYRILRTPRWGAMMCFCEIESKTALFGKLHRMYRSAYSKKSMDNFVLWGSLESRKTLDKFYKDVYKWAEWPDRWLTIIGATGSGKSHTLTSLADFFGVWALYITATDFDAWLSRLMDSEEDGTLTEFLDVIKTAPILLFDDLGSEYVKTGKDWVRANLRKIIDFRYLRPKEFITVVTTNLAPDYIMQYDMRIGSRILDIDNTDILELASVGDYRRRTG